MSPQMEMENNGIEGGEEELERKAMEIARGIAFPMTLKSAMELNILEIISEEGDHLSSSEVAGKIPGCVNPGAPALIDRMLSLLTSFSILKCKLRSNNREGGVERVYGPAPLCKYFLTNGNNSGLMSLSLRPWFLMQHDKVASESWNHLNEAVLEGGTPFERAYKMPIFEFFEKDSKLNKLVNQSMSDATMSFMKKMIDTYRGFEGVNVLVDVGGGLGTTLKLITSKYPNIRGINFDLPRVIPDALKTNPGVEHVAGDMFERVPSGDAIFLKWVLHNWNEEHCLKLLKNCWQALPQNGKVIVVESLIPLIPDDTSNSKATIEQDVTMFVILGTKKWTIEELQALVFQSGFSSCDVVCSIDNYSVIEFIKA